MYMEHRNLLQNWVRESEHSPFCLYLGCKSVNFPGERPRWKREGLKERRKEGENEAIQLSTVKWWSRAASSKSPVLPAGPPYQRYWSKCSVSLWPQRYQQTITVSTHRERPLSGEVTAIKYPKLGWDLTDEADVRLWSLRPCPSAQLWKVFGHQQVDDKINYNCDRKGWGSGGEEGRWGGSGAGGDGGGYRLLT